MPIYTIEKKLKDLGLDKETMSNLYYSTENKELCKKFKINNPALIRWLNFLKINLKGKGNRKSKKNEKKY